MLKWLGGLSPRRASFFEQRRKFSLAPGFSPVMTVEKRREAVSTASVCRETR
jgi:hypothetical protein